MNEANYTVLQQKYGGRYVARRGADVIADASTYDELTDQIEKAVTDWSEIIIEYIEPANTVCVY